MKTAKVDVRKAELELTLDQIRRCEYIGSGASAAVYEHPLDKDLVIRVEFLGEGEEGESSHHFNSIENARMNGYPVLRVLNQFWVSELDETCDGEPELNWYECLVKERVETTICDLYEDNAEWAKVVDATFDGVPDPSCTLVEFVFRLPFGHTKHLSALKVLKKVGKIRRTWDGDDCELCDIHDENVAIHKGRIVIIDC